MRRSATVAVLFLTLFACGDDDDDSATEPPATTARATTTSVVPPGSAATTRPATTAAGPTTLSCETVAFTPNSEDAASDIKATGLTCEEAEELVRAAGERTSSGGPQRVQVDGYRCVLLRTEDDPLPRAFYECTSGSKKVSFVRS